MAQPASLEGDSSIIVDLSEAAMHMYTAAIDALPFAEDKKFHKRADVVLSGMRKLRAALTDAASTSRPSPAVIVALSNVRRRYDALMEHTAAAPGSSVGQQVYATRIQARLSAREAKILEAIAALGGVPGTEHLQPRQPEADDEPEEPAESHVNGWDEDLVGENAG